MGLCLRIKYRLKFSSILTVVSLLRPCWISLRSFLKRFRRFVLPLPDGRQANCLQDLLGLKATLYDPAYLPYAQFPQEQSDLVVCTDVLEHCPPEDVPWIVEELFMLARKFVFANIACYPARKYLRNGENAHCTVAPVEWWSEQIWRVAQRYANIDYRFICKDADGKETFIANPLVVD